MSVTKVVLGMLSVTGKNQQDLAEAFGMSKQAFSTKMKNDSWKAKDLVKAASACGWRVCIVSPDGDTLYLQSEEAPDA